MPRNPKFSQEQRTAYHEAGHAVAAHICKHAPAIRKVTIVPTEEAHGHVAPYPESSFNPEIHTDLRKIADRVTVLLAGNEAVKKLTGRYDNRGASGDHDVAMELALYLGGSGEQATALLHWVQLRARNLVHTRWDSIRAVAAELLNRKTLSGRETHHVIEEDITRQIAQRRTTQPRT